MSELKEEFEKIWRDFPLAFPNHKAGWAHGSDELGSTRGCYILPAKYFKLVLIRGERYPLPKRKSKYQGYLRSYLTDKGREYNHYRQVQLNRQRIELVGPLVDGTFKVWDTNKRAFSGD